MHGIDVIIQALHYTCITSRNMRRVKFKPRNLDCVISKRASKCAVSNARVTSVTFPSRGEQRRSVCCRTAATQRISQYFTIRFSAAREGFTVALDIPRETKYRRLPNKSGRGVCALFERNSCIRERARRRRRRRIFTLLRSRVSSRSARRRSRVTSFRYTGLRAALRGEY